MSLPKTFQLTQQETIDLIANYTLERFNVDPSTVQVIKVVFEFESDQRIKSVECQIYFKEGAAS